MLSFDIFSLYTNVQVKETMDVCTKIFFEKKRSEERDEETFKVLLELACYDVIFSLHDAIISKLKDWRWVVLLHHT